MSVMILAVLLSSPLAPAFSPIAPLLGRCWQGVMPDGGVDTHCFTREGAVVRDRHVVRKRGKAVYRGVTDYTISGERLRWAYRNAGGPVMAGEVTAAPGAIRFSVDGGAPLTWRWQGARAYAAQVGPRGETVTFRRSR